MYEVIRNVILTGRFELVDMLNKIDTIWLHGNVTDEQRAELVELARKKAVPENSYAGFQTQLNTLREEITKQNIAISKLAEKVALLEGEEVIPPEETEKEEYPEYVQPAGAHDAYFTDGKVTENGKKYVCIAPKDVPVVWPPSVMPSYWQEVIE